MNNKPQQQQEILLPANIAGMIKNLSDPTIPQWTKDNYRNQLELIRKSIEDSLRKYSITGMEKKKKQK